MKLVRGHACELADRFIEHLAEGWWAGMGHASARSVPAAKDWNDWHHADGQGYTGEGER